MIFRVVTHSANAAAHVATSNKWGFPIALCVAGAILTHRSPLAWAASRSPSRLRRE